MAVANALAYFDMVTTTTVKSFIIQDPLETYAYMVTIMALSSFIVQDSIGNFYSSWRASGGGPGSL
jgi:hypothetical protein